MKGLIKTGVSVFVIRRGKILLGKRRNVVGNGTWGLPSGHQEPGETMLQTAARELKEETGLTAKTLLWRCMYDDIRPNEHYIQVGFEALGVGSEPKLLEPEKCEEWRWFSIDDTRVLIFFPHKKLLEIFTRKQNF
jgi:8-oxo-dGTP diphosphatase